eukprot:Phypoly_transcript_03216.p1 GENE.Phypoly_transcript_03216~~Phypoly_transcript_03216.p1  ORF type:complete len:797 (+),score=113.92 Phypoly_transcript_03216:105-2495(+)
MDQENGTEQAAKQKIPTGPITIKELALPHKSVATEWWLFNGHLHTDGNTLGPPPFSFCVSVCKLLLAKRKLPGCLFSCSIIDMRDGKGRYYTDSVLDLQCRAGLEATLLADQYEMDKMIKEALLEMLRKDVMPGPERTIPNSAKISQVAPLVLDFGTAAQFTHDEASGVFKISCAHPDQNMALDLELTPQRAPIRQIHTEAVEVSIPKLAISGKMSVPSLQNKGVQETFEVSGSGWYGHVFGSEPTGLEQLKHKHLMHGFSLQLSNNTEIGVSMLLDPDTKGVVEKICFISDAHSHKEYPDLELKALPDGRWISMRTSITYSTKWRLTIPSANVDLVVEPAMESQEFVSYTRNPALWEGRVHVTGTVNGAPVTGYGFLEMNATAQTPTLKQFYKNIAKDVLQQLAEALPLNPTVDDICSMIGAPRHILKNIDVDVVVKTIIKPLRDLIDIGGNCWRSYAALLCIDCVGGDSNKFRRFMTFPEIVQAGILIIDDIQDKSDVRRGAPACHKVYGEAIAITAGNAAYFLAMNYLEKETGIDTSLKLKAYHNYFVAMRAGHVGQGFDLNGFEDLMPDAIESGDYTRLVDRIHTCYVLKTGYPFAVCARLGADLGGGTQQEVDNIANYFQALAFTFQIIDDVLNLRGFESQAKTRGEDITEGKITYPIAMAMSSKLVPSKEARQSIFDRLKSRPNPNLYSQKMQAIQKEIDALKEKNSGSADLQKLQEEYETNKKIFQQHHDTLFGLIDELEQCGALEQANQTAHKMMEEAWQELDKVLPDTRYKVMVRSFGQYALKGFYA